MGATGLEPVAAPLESIPTQDVTARTEIPLAHSLAREMENDPDLARIIDAWPTLPATAKRMILAAVDASKPGAQ